jgi:hypothetical protein
MVPLVGGTWAEAKTLAIGTVTPGPDGTAHTTELSYFSRMTDAERFGRLALVEVQRRGVATAKRVCAVNDGAAWIPPLVALHRPDAILILDNPHAVEHLAAAAQVTFGAGTAALACWLERTRHTLRHGDPADVLEALCLLPVAQAADPAHAAEVRDETVQYLARRWECDPFPRNALCGAGLRG